MSPWFGAVFSLLPLMMMGMMEVGWGTGTGTLSVVLLDDAGMGVNHVEFCLE